MTDLQVLMPMGGLGSRFSKAGYTTPKALIDVDGKPMFMRSLDSFRKLDNVQYIFVIRKEHEAVYNLSYAIKQHLPSARISIVDHDTGGAVETCMIAEDLIDDATPIAIADCDIYFESTSYFEQALSSRKSAGMLLTFESRDPRYSYVELDGEGKVVRTAEKQAISNSAILGGYYFSSGKLFKSLSKTFLSKPLPKNLKEYYVSHLFNLLISEGLPITIAPIDKMYIFGTPEELNSYLDQGNNEK